MREHFEYKIVIRTSNPYVKTEDLKKLFEAWRYGDYRIWFLMREDGYGDYCIEISAGREIRGEGVNITRHWNEVSASLEKGEIPDWLVEKVLNQKIVSEAMKIEELLKTKGELHMKAQEMKESVKASEKLEKEVKNLTTGECQKYLENIKETTPVKEENEIAPVAAMKEETVEKETTGESEKNTDTNGDTEDSVKDECDKKTTTLSNCNLPTIQSSDKKVMLCIRGDYALIMMPLYDAESLVVEDCKLYLHNLETNMVHIGAGAELKIDKSKILSATDHGVMKILKRFTVNFTEDDMKIAYERAKTFLENVNTMVEISTSMNIQQAYIEIVKFAIEKAEQEKSAKVMDIEIKCKYDEKAQVISIKDSYLQEILDEVGAGYTKVVFCKKLCMLEAHYGVSLIIRKKGRYTCNETGNNRFYKFIIVDELLCNGGVA